MRVTDPLVIFLLAAIVTGCYGSRYLGCYKEPSSGPARLLAAVKKNFQGTLTNLICIDHCRSKGFRYAGTEWKLECFCSNIRPTYQSMADESDCNLKCEGDETQICGGNLRINVYDTTDSAGNPVNTHYVGCYEDKEDRLLKGSRWDSDIQTPELCVGYCYRRGFRFAGIEFGKECFCGDTLPSSAKVQNNQCDMDCGGDQATKCGASWRLSVYHTGIPDLPYEDNYLGCFKDDASSVRLLSGVRFVFKETNTPKRCMNVCLGAGYKYSGTEYGYECFCGNRKPSPDIEVEENHCHMACTGDGRKFCGGEWRILAYSTGSGEVKPVIEVDTTTAAPTTKKPVVQPGTPLGTTPKPPKSKTTVNGRNAVKGQVIFREDFLGNKIDVQKWSQAVFMPWTPDYDFVTFTGHSENSYVRDGKLFIKPTLMTDDFVRKGRIDLQNCTGQQYSEECERQAATFSILPPVSSARLHTKDSFSFRFGIVQIVAKLPLGDWIIPEIWLEPKRKNYGISYASGRVRIAMARGNKILIAGNQDIGNKQLESGILMGIGENIRGRTIVRDHATGWNEDFHNFTFIWTPENLSFMVDGQNEEELIPPEGGVMCELVGLEDECDTWRTGSSIAPFDTEFYISLGLTVGGMRDFPDNSASGHVVKPWKNMAVKAMAHFWQGKEDWKATWDDQKIALQVESVKVIAL